jgi:hypothetical protein
MKSLIGLLQEKGIKNTLSVVEKMGNPHIEDDFHRFLIQYIKAGYSVPGFSESSAIWKPGHMTLYEITLTEVHLYIKYWRISAESIFLKCTSVDKWLHARTRLLERSHDIHLTIDIFVKIIL